VNDLASAGVTLGYYPLVVLLSAASLFAVAPAAESQHPLPPTGFEAALIGLLEVPLMYDALPSDDPKLSTPKRLEAHEQPSVNTRVVATLDATGITRADGVRCGWHREPQCRYHESAYEVSALAVFAMRPDGWYRIAIDRDGVQFGWIQSDATHHPLESLALGQERLTYLTPAWRGTLHDRGGANRVAVPRKAQTPYRALRPIAITGRLWIEVEVLAGACSGGPEDERVVGKGWVPVRDAAGELNVWYWSRGC
jgi:hypothetical protein